MTEAALLEAPGPAPRARSSIEEDPRWVSFAMGTRGKLAIFSVFAVIVTLVEGPKIAAVALVGAALCTFARARRDYAILLATLTGVLLDPAWHWDPSFAAFIAKTSLGLAPSPRTIQRVLTAAFFALSFVLLRYVARRPSSLVARRPVVTLLATIAVLSGVALGVAAPGPGLVWLVLLLKTVAVYMWFLVYAVVDQRAARRGSAVLAVGAIRPFWAPFTTPIGKGGAYLTKMQCRSEEELAHTRLKALKLIVWSWVLLGASRIIQLVSVRLLGVPPLRAVLDAFAHGRVVPVHVGWIAVVVGTATTALELASWGHEVVACARLAGFKLRRNTWRPLESRSLADFWNRYYYYFKELLVDAFFYPAFLRMGYLKERPRLRTFCATFFAAGVGNAVYHFFRDVDLLFTMGPRAALVGFESYALYCLVLALGIGLSQIRGEARGIRSTRSGLPSRLWSFACVWGFVACLHVFSLETRIYPLGMRLSFMAHQIGAGP